MKWVLFFFVSIPSWALPIGYGSSDAVYPAKNQEFFYMGFNLGMELAGYKQLDTIVDNVRIADQKALGAIRGLKQLFERNKDLSVVVGYPTSHEALLVSKLINQNQILFLSVAGSHSELGNMGPYVYTLGESLISAQSAVLKYKIATYAKKKGLIVVNPRATFSANQKALFLKMTKELKSEQLPSFDFVDLDEQMRLPKEALDKLASQEYSYIILTTYPDDSLNLFEQLVARQVNLHVYTNPSWIIGDIEIVRRSITDFKGEVFSISSMIRGTQAASLFEKAALKKYGTAAKSEMYYGYDVGRIIGQTLKRIQGEVTKESFFAAFRKDLCFQNTSSGTLCFPKTGGHAYRNVYLLRFTKEAGFKPDKLISKESP